MRPRLTYANCMSTFAVFLALSTGGAYAKATLIDGRSIKANSINSTKLTNNSITAADVKNGSLSASDLSRAAAEQIVEAGAKEAPGEPCVRMKQSGAWVQTGYGLVCAPYVNDATRNGTPDTAQDYPPLVYGGAATVDAELGAGSSDYYRATVPCTNGRVTGQSSPGQLTVGFAGDASLRGFGGSRIDAFNPGETSPYAKAGNFFVVVPRVCEGYATDRVIIFRVSDDDQLPFKYRMEVLLGVGF